MKILFIHLSDMHFEDETDIKTTKTKMLIKAIKSKSNLIDECIIVCSGDVTNSAEVKQYETANNFFNYIIEESMDEFCNGIKLFVVPGNHDLNLSGDKRDSTDIEKILDDMSESEINKIALDELCRNKNFFSSSFIEKNINQPILVSSKKIELSDISLSVNLLNTSIFSALNSDTKGLHYLPSNELQKLSNNNADISISIMHHSYEYFHYNCSKELKNGLYNNSDIIFIGHEHTIESEMLNESIWISRGGSYSTTYTKESEFKAIVFDTELKTISESVFTWNDKNVIFYENLMEGKKLNFNKSGFSINKNFKNDFFSDNQGTGNDCLKYFVFPTIKHYENKFEEKHEDGVISEDEFINIAINNSIINIVSRPENGKTTFLKYLFNNFYKNNYTPIYLSNLSYLNNMETAINNVFKKQFSSNNNEYDKFKQLPKSKRIVLFDDFDKISDTRKRKDIFNYLKQNFGVVIFTTTQIDEIDFEESINKFIESEYMIRTLKLQNFYYTKRNELIKSMCKSCGINDVDVIDSVKQAMNEFINKNMSIINLSPSMLIQYIKFFIEGNEIRQKDDSALFVIFENNIRNLIRKNVHDNDLNDYLTFLTDFAYNLHQKQNTRFSHSEISKYIDYYNDHMMCNINALNFLEAMKRSEIICGSENNNHFEFTNINYYAYFIAKKIDINIGKAEMLKDIDNLVKNICFSLNDKILMFLTNIRNNTQFILELCDELDKILEDYPEICLNPSNLSVFDKMSNNTIDMPTNRENNLIDRRIEEDEIHRIEQNKEGKVAHDEYNNSGKDVEKYPYNLIRAHKYLEIISKTFISQYSNLNGLEKIKVSKHLIEIPNKLAYASLKPFSDNFDNIVKKLYELLQEMGDSILKGKSQGDVQNLLVDHARAIMLSLFDNIAYISNTSKTYEIFEKLNIEGETYDIQKLMRLSFLNNNNKFIHEAITMLKRYKKNKIMKTIIRLIVRVFLIRHDNLDYKLKQRISSKIYNKSTTEQLNSLLKR